MANKTQFRSIKGGKPMTNNNNRRPMPNIPMDPIQVKVGGRMISVPKLSNENVEGLLMAYGNSKSLPDLAAAVEALRDAVVFIPGKIDEQKRISSAIIRNAQGESFIPVFTSASQMTEKTPDMPTILPLPFKVVNEMFAKMVESGQDLKAMAVNPVTMNILLAPKLSQLILAADVESNKAGEKKPVDLGIKPVQLPDIDNKKAEELAIAFRDETDQEKKGPILNNILDVLYGADIVFRIGTDSNGKEKPEILQHKENQTKRLPMYTRPNLAVKPGEYKKISILPFKKALEYYLTMGEDILGIVLVTPDTALTLDRPLLVRVAEVNKKRDEMTAQAEAKVKAQAEAIEKDPEELDEATRAVAEHQKFELFYLPETMREKGQAFIDELIERREEYLDELFEASYYDILMYPYLSEEFSIMTLTTDDGLDAICIDFPERDQGLACAAHAYIIWDKASQKGRYFAITRGMNNQFALIEQTPENSIPWGPAPKEGNELSTVLDIVKNK